MLRFKPMDSLRMFAAIDGSVHNHFHPERRLTSRSIYKQARIVALAEWQGALRWLRTANARNLRRVRIRLKAPNGVFQDARCGFVVLYISTGISRLAPIYFLESLQASRIAVHARAATANPSSPCLARSSSRSAGFGGGTALMMGPLPSVNRRTPILTRRCRRGRSYRQRRPVLDNCK
jgi:putative transposase